MELLLRAALRNPANELIGLGPAATAWEKRKANPEPCDAPILYASADDTGLPMRKAVLAGRKGKQADGTAS